MFAVSAEHLSKCYRMDKSGPFAGARATLARLTGRPAPKRGSLREVWALNDVNFAVEPGTIVGVIGPNGAGKTTLLKILGRVTLPTRGRVLGRGRVVSLLALGSGFQPDLSGRENVFLQAALYGVPSAEVNRNFKEIADFAELGEFMDVQVRRYSSGMYIRLAFAAAIHMDGDILLADEVLAVGDLAFQERCLERVQRAGREGMTVFFVSHDMSAIRRLCQRVIWLSAGRIVEDGDPETVIAHYESAALGGNQGRVGSPANEHARIIGTRLLNSDGDEIGAMRVADAPALELALEVFTPGLEVRCALSVSARGTLAFRSTQPEPFTVSEPGVYQFRAHLPPDLLSDTTYTVKSGAALRFEGEDSFLVQDDAVVFNVYAPDDTLPLWGGYRERAGLISPRLSWQVIQERTRVSA
jgi:lipopolysaccharide transport system ATP-binding protein